MRIAKLETFPVNIAYTRLEKSALIARAGVSDVVVKLTTDDGLVGWGEACMNSETAGIVAAVEAARPFLLGRSPWEGEAIARDYFITGGWQFQATTGNFAFAGIDMALWDLCGKAAGQPIHRLLGGPLRDSVDYFYYLQWGSAEDVAAQCEDGVARGYQVFYMKAGVDEAAEEAMLALVRDCIGPSRKIRIDPNQAWTVPQAAALIARWHARYDIDFVEGPVLARPFDAMLDLKARSPAPLCLNEGLWGVPEVIEAITRRAADYLCFSPYWVGTVRRFMMLAQLAAAQGMLVCKHTHGEFGLAAALGQHLCLAIPNASLGHQQTAQMMAGDILAERLPIADGPRWGIIEGAGLGVTLDEAKLAAAHEAYRRNGAFMPYGTRD
jgi:L-alanine-DL-glutamate epimerase-like enolase superfamily enzyme